MKVHPSGELQLEGAVIAIGAFDGVHKGHKKVIQHAVQQSKLLGVPSVIYTFDPPPRVYFQNAQILSTVVEKMAKFHRLGVDHTIIATFNEAYLNRTAQSFISELSRMNPQQVIVGEDFRFGHKRMGDIHLLKEHFDVATISPVCCSEGERISSTRIRQLIHEGKVDEAIPFLA